MTRPLTPWLTIGGHSVCAGRLEFKPADLWIGAYWTWVGWRYPVLHVWICLVPMLPLHLVIRPTPE
jgi:hypothetical protein